MKPCISSRLDRRAPVVVLLVLSMAGCGGSTGSAASRKAGEAPPLRHLSRVFLGDCLFAQPETEAFLAPLLAAVLPSLIQAGFNRLGKTLEASATEKTWQSTTFTNFEMSDTHFPKCVLVIRGPFAYSADKMDLEWAEGSPFAKQTDRMKARGIYLSGKPDFYFEGKFRASAEGPALSIVPVVASFEKPIGDRALRTGEGRYVKLDFAFHPPAKPAAAADNPATQLILGHLEKGAFHEYDASCAPGSVTPSAGALPSQPGGDPSAGGNGNLPANPPAPKSATRACPDESLWFAIPRTAALTPMSLTVSTAEVQGDSAFLGLLSEVFKESRDDLEALAKRATIAAEAEKARLAELEADHALAVAYDQALIEALSALETCAAGPTVANAGAARIKQKAANLAAAKAGEPAPFGDSHLVPVDSGNAV
ncbi:MAG TPA: hypothetical protein VIG29_09300, partial [Vicinamibacteria bacterium]